MTRPMPDEFRAALESRVTRMCWCFIVTREDGTVLGFTDHNEPLEVEGVTCEPETGFDASTLDTTLGTVTDGTDIVGLIDDERITRDDLELGLWDNATVRMLRVDWTNPSQFAEMPRHQIAEVEITSDTLAATLQSALTEFSEERGRLLEHDCSVVFGGPECGIDLATLALEAEVIALGSDYIEASGLTGFEDAHFDLGKVVFADGEEAFILRHDGNRLTFFDPLIGARAVEDQITITPGCDLSFATCKAYGNADNYRGFPFMLGSDAVIQQGAYAGQLGGVSQFNDEAPAAPTGLALLALSGNTATIGFDGVPQYIKAVSPVETAAVYGRNGQIEVPGLPFDQDVEIELVAVLGDLVSDPPATITVPIGLEPQSQDGSDRDDRSGGESQIDSGADGKAGGGDETKTIDESDNSQSSGKAGGDATK